MGVNVLATTVIERPIAEVAAYAGDPSNAPEWCRQVESAEWRTDPPTTLGSRITFHTRFLGRELVSTHEIVEYTPGEQVAMRTAGGPLPIDTVSTWRPLSESKTHMALRNHGRPRGVGKLVAPLVRRVLRRAMTRDLADLKRLLESR